MQADYYYGASGIRVKNNLYSSSSVEANLKVRGSKLVSLQFSLPQDRNDILSAHSEMFVLKYDVDVPQKGIEKRYTNSTCTWPVVDRAVGLKTCTDYSVPDVSDSTQTLPSLWFCGPIKIDVHTDKADSSAKVFLFEYRWDDALNGSKGSFVFETPGSNIPRIFTANVTHDVSSYNVSMSFLNGDTAHSATVTYVNTEDEKLLQADLILDGKRSFDVEV